jgi:carbon-monoxide dehydrogenase iron sulfur subunit
VIIQVDPAQCTDCRLCEIYCSFQQEGYVNPTLARIHIQRDASRKLLVPIVCPPCGEKKCIAVCPEPGALTILPQTGAIVIAEALCTGCSKCVVACDIGAIQFLRQDGRGKNGKAVALKCNQCDGDPACMRVCEPKALQYVQDGVTARSNSRDEGVTLGQHVFERLRAVLLKVEPDSFQRGGQPRRRMHSR